MVIIGLSGFARSGKDEAAKYLVENHGFTRIAFADKLRDFLYALNPMVALEVPAPRENPIDLSEPVQWEKLHLQTVIDETGWDHYKETVYGPEIRRLLQRLGTEAGRQTLWDTIWIDAALNGMGEGNYVVTDARFLNEFAAIEDRGGLIVRINRAGVGPANEHASEMEALQYHFEHVINNDLDLEFYHDRVEDMYQHLRMLRETEWQEIG